ncbi:MAG: hypothetical protein JNM59_08955 [Hyphomonadaceae bacterium]|nr:hypothetical protein [Hyphomonadaceae bacterium]
MRSLIRGLSVGVFLTAAALLPTACQRQAGGPAEDAANSANADRGAEMAAEQLAALGGAANAEQRALYEGDFQASGGIDPVAGEGGEADGGGGGEGAWELRLFEDYAQFSRPGLGENGGIPGERDYRERGMRVVAGDVTVTITQQPCSASGIELPYTANVIFEGVAYQGCARRGVEEGERPTWATVLPDLIPAIDTCLPRMRSARVTFASDIGDDRVSVRMRGGDGARAECVVGAGAVEVFEPLTDSDRRPGEGDPEFQRGGDQPAARNCRASEQAIGRDGQPIGWLIRRTC